MAKHRKISEREARFDPIPENESQEEKQKRLEIERIHQAFFEEHPDAYEILGYSQDIDDVGWVGGNDGNGQPRLTKKEWQQYLDGDLGEYNAFEQLIWKVIEQNRIDDFRSKKAKASWKTFDQYRFEHAMQCLTGRRPTKRPPDITEAQLEQMARGYLAAVVQIGNDEDFIERLIYQALGLSGDEATQNEISNRVRRSKEKFYAEFQRIMMKISWHDDEAQEYRRNQVEKAIGIILDQPALPKKVMKPTDA